MNIWSFPIVINERVRTSSAFLYSLVAALHYRSLIFNFSTTGSYFNYYLRLKNGRSAASSNKKKHLVAMVTHCNNCPKVGRNRNHSYYTAKPTDLLQHTANMSAAILLFRASINWLCPLSIHFIISPSICISTHIFIYHPIPPWFFHPSKFQPSIHFCI